LPGQVFEHCGAPIVLADARRPDYPVVAVNAAFERITGYRREEILGKNCRFLQGTDAQPEAKAQIRRALRRGEPVRVLLRNYRKDGTLFWNQLDLAPLRDAAGEITHYIGVQGDVTRLKQLEESETDSVRRWEALFDSLPVGVVLADMATHRFAFANQSLAKMLGYDAVELVGKTPADLHRPEDFAAVGREFERMVRGESTVALNQPFLRRDGRLCFCDVHAVSLVYGGRPCLCGILLDNSERRRMETELQEILERLDAVLQANPDIMLIFDREGRIIDCLPRVDARFFRPVAEFLGQPVEAVMPPAVAALARARVAEVLAEGRLVQADYQLPHPEGDRYYEARFFPYLGDQVLTVVRDVTELRLAEHSLASSHAEFVSLFDTMAQGVVYQDAAGQIVRVNAAACDLLGLSPDQLAGRTSVDPTWQALREDGTLFPGAEHPAMVSLRTGRSVENVVMGVARPDRSERVWLLVSARPEFKPGASRPHRVFTSFTDITARRRDEELLKRQARIQELLLEISAVFINLPAERVEPAIQQALADLGRYFEADRSFIFSGNEDLTAVSNTHEWCAPGVAPQIEHLQEVPVADLTSWMGAFRRGESYEVEDVQALPPASPERQILEPQGITSLITTPLMQQGVCLGFVGLDFVGRHRKTTEAEQRLLRVFAQSVVNVRDRLAIQRELVESRGFLADIIENSGSLIYLKDAAGRYTNVNRRYLSTVGLSREQVIGRRDEEIYPAPVAAQFRGHDEEMLRQGGIRQFEETLADPEGIRHFVSVKFPTRDADGTVTGLAGMSTEITALKRNEQLEQKRGEVLAALLAAEPLDAIYPRLVGFVENSIPGARCSILTVDHERQVLQMACAPRLPDEYNAAVHGVPVAVGVGACGTSAATGEPYYTADIQTDPYWTPAFRALAAQAGVVSCWSTPIRSSSGRILGTYAIYLPRPGRPNEEQIRYLAQAAALSALTMDQAHARRDRQARLEAETLARTHQRFLARMSHEIRTPLNAVIGFSHSLLRRPALGTEERRQIGAIASSGEHLLGLINDILDFAKIEAANLVPEPEDFSPAPFFEGLVDVFRPRAEDKGLEFHYEPPGTWPPWVRGDAQKLRQILHNLLGNALKFTAAGWLRLSVELDETAAALDLRITVADTGPGIPAEELPRIFDDFYQGQPGRAAGGTGLGLAISRRLATCLGGDLTASSHPGQGSTFTCRIPLRPATAATPTTATRAVEVEREAPLAALPPNLTAAQVAAALAPEDRLALAEAVAQGRMREFRTRLAALPGEEMTVRDALNKLADHYDYDSLRRLLSSPPAAP
jgi:PAS domain S-box-containing protein